MPSHPKLCRPAWQIEAHDCGIGGPGLQAWTAALEQADSSRPAPSSPAGAGEGGSASAWQRRRWRSRHRSHAAALMASAAATVAGCGCSTWTATHWGRRALRRCGLCLKAWRKPTLAPPASAMTVGSLAITSSCRTSRSSAPFWLWTYAGACGPPCNAHACSLNAREFSPAQPSFVPWQAPGRLRRR